MAGEREEVYLHRLINSIAGFSARAEFERLATPRPNSIQAPVALAANLRLIRSETIDGCSDIGLDRSYLAGICGWIGGISARRNLLTASELNRCNVRAWRARDSRIRRNVHLIVYARWQRRIMCRAKCDRCALRGVSDDEHLQRLADKVCDRCSLLGSPDWIGKQRLQEILPAGS